MAVKEEPYQHRAAHQDSKCHPEMSSAGQNMVLIKPRLWAQPLYRSFPKVWIWWSLWVPSKSEYSVEPPSRFILGKQRQSKNTFLHTQGTVSNYFVCKHTGTLPTLMHFPTQFCWLCSIQLQMHSKILLLLLLLFYYAGKYNSEIIDINLTCWGKHAFIHIIAVNTRKLHFTDSASHKTWQKSYSVIDPLTALDARLWVNFEFKIWPYSPFLEWLLSLLFLSKYVGIVYTAFQNIYTIHIPLEWILYFCNYPQTNSSFPKLFYSIPNLI